MESSKHCNHWGRISLRVHVLTCCCTLMTNVFFYPVSLRLVSLDSWYLCACSTTRCGASCARCGQHISARNQPWAQRNECTGNSTQNRACMHRTSRNGALNLFAIIKGMVSRRNTAHDCLSRLYQSSVSRVHTPPTCCKQRLLQPKF